MLRGVLRVLMVAQERYWAVERGCGDGRTEDHEEQLPRVSNSEGSTVGPRKGGTWDLSRRADTVEVLEAQCICIELPLKHDVCTTEWPYALHIKVRALYLVNRAILRTLADTC